MFENVTVNKFAGLNSNTAPELIKEGELKDVDNLRHEKLGKLVNRNGVQYGLYCKTETPSGNMLADYPRFASGEYEYYNNRGIIGIGEYNAEGNFPLANSGKLMVYAIRTKEQYNKTGNTKDLMAYIFAPLEGTWTDKVLNFAVSNISDPTDGVSYVINRDKNPQNNNINERSFLYAPPALNSSIVGIDYSWIDAFLDMHQYRQTMVISDRTNGDTLIEDAYSLRTGQETPALGVANDKAVEHSLRIRPNSLDVFDIDIVSIDLRLAEDQENDANATIETGMALYQFEVDKDEFKITNDYFEGSPSDVEYYDNLTAQVEELNGYFTFTSAPYFIQNYRESYLDKFAALKNISQTALSITQVIPSLIMPEVDTEDNYGTYINGADYLNEGRPILDYHWNENLTYTFSNNAEAGEFSNILNPVRLKKERTVNEKNEEVNSYASDVHIWQELKAQYRPVSDKNRRYYLLTDADKEWDRTLPGVPRIVEFETLEGAQKEVPLSVWRYRFVWDYGNGILSAPSTEILAPDILWQQKLSDEQYDVQSNRINVEAADITRTLHKFQNSGVQFGDIASGIISQPAHRPFDNTTRHLTDIGYNIWKIKNALYNTTHKFGGQYEGTRAELDDLFDDPANAENAENFSTFITVISGNIIEMGGFIGETLSIAAPNVKGTRIEVGPNLVLTQIKLNLAWENTAVALGLKMETLGVGRTKIMDYLNSAPPVLTGRLKLLIPIIPTANSATFNSLFDAKGKLRTGYLNTNTISTQYVPTGSLPGSELNFTWGSRISKKQMILTGYNAGINFAVNDKTLNDSFKPDGRWWSIDNAIYTIPDYLIPGNDLDVVNPYVMLLNDINAYNDGGVPYDLRNILLANDNVRYNDVAKRNVLTNNFLEYICSEAALPDYGTRQSKGLFLNFICPPLEGNNDNLLSDERIATLLRHVSNEPDRLSKFKTDLSAEVRQRMLLEGSVPIDVLTSNKDIQEEFYWQSQYHVVSGLEQWEGGPWDEDYTAFYNVVDTLERDKPRYPYLLQSAVHPLTVVRDENGLIPKMTYPDYLDRTLNNPTQPYQQDYKVFKTDNIDATIYLEGERLLAYEQLTSVFPSSFLFNAPRLGFSISKDKIPLRAKRLLIYRTIASHNNSYDPNKYGLVNTIEIYRRTEAGTDAITNIDYAKGEAYTIDEDGKRTDGIYYFDKIQDVELDFNSDVEASEGLRKPIHSRFNIAINERVYYGNYKEWYRPEKPRKHEPNVFTGTENPLPEEVLVGGSGSPKLIRYDVDVLDGSRNIMQLPQPVLPIISAVHAVAYHDLGSRVLVGTTGNPSLQCYDTTLNAWQTVPLPTGTFTQDIVAIIYNTARTKVAIGFADVPYIRIYDTNNNSEDFLTWTIETEIEPAAFTTVETLRFTNDDTKLLVGTSGTNFGLKIYNTVDWSVAANPTGYVNSNVYSIDINFNDTYIAIGTSASPFLQIVDVLTWTVLPALSIPPVAQCNVVKINGQFLFVGMESYIENGVNADTPLGPARYYLAIYKISDWSFQVLPQETRQALYAPISALAINYEANTLYVGMKSVITPNERTPIPYQDYFRMIDIPNWTALSEVVVPPTDAVHTFEIKPLLPIIEGTIYDETAETRWNSDGSVNTITPPNYFAPLRNRNTHYYCFEVTDEGRGIPNTTYVQYAYNYEDVDGIISDLVITDVIDPCYSWDSIKNAIPDTRFDFSEVVLYYIPHSYNAGIKKANIYRKFIDIEEYNLTNPNGKVIKHIRDNDTENGKYQSWLDITEAIGLKKWYKIGEVTEKELGIFRDDFTYQSEEVLGSYHEVFNNYESGVKYSEPYRPDFIKAENMFEVKSGDGSQITGLAVNYGNLIISKENSLHRKTLQNTDATVSRTDEVADDIGCIAPETWITVDNIIYFLSHKGIYSYDGNELNRIDSAISEEIQALLIFFKQKLSNTTALSHYFRYVTAGYNPVYKELYFNFPMPFEPDGDNNAYDIDNQGAYWYRYFRQFTSHIYVYNLEVKIWTKFSYFDNVDDKDWENLVTEDDESVTRYPYYIRRYQTPMDNVRLYHTNSLGQMRSADIKPNQYIREFFSASGFELRDDIPDWAYINQKFNWAGIYVETPYLQGNLNFGDNNGSYQDFNQLTKPTTLGTMLYSDYTLHATDHIINNREFQYQRSILNPPIIDRNYFVNGEWCYVTNTTIVTEDGVDKMAVRFFSNAAVEVLIPVTSLTLDIDNYHFYNNIFPPTRAVPIKVMAELNVNTKDRETVLKRVNRVVSNIFSEGNIKITIAVNSHLQPDERIERNYNLHEFTFEPTRITAESNPHPLTRVDRSATVTNKNVLTTIPEANITVISEEDYTIDDTNLKGISATVKIEAEMKTQINEITLYYRPIHLYLQ